MNEHDQAAVAERTGYIAYETLDDVHCLKCGRRIGAYVGLAQCKGCGAWNRVPLTAARR